MNKKVNLLFAGVVFFLLTNFLTAAEPEIHKLARRGKVNKLRVLLAQNPELIDKKDRFGWTALQLAAAKGHLKVVKLLIDTGADINATDQFGFTALHLAALKGNHKIFGLLVNNGANTRSNPGKEEIFGRIFNAAEIRDELAEVLFSSIPDKDRDRILSDLARKEQDESFVFAKMSLKQEWIDVNLERSSLQGKEGKQGPLRIAPAAIKRLKELAERFIGNRMDARDRENLGNTLLHTAAQKGETKKFEKLLKANLHQVNAQNYFGITPLHYAAAGGFLSIAKQLVTAGAKIDARTRSGITPLYGAVSGEQEEMVRFLISKGAKIDTTTADGATALHIASTKGIARLLVKAGAKVRAANKFGFTPLHIAAHYGHIGVADYLLSKGAHMESRTNTGWTAICEAVYNKQLQMVKFLAEKGADVNARTKGGSSPMDLAVTFKDEEIAAVLRKYGALPIALPVKKR
jgi:ankyrin repeat protein